MFDQSGELFLWKRTDAKFVESSALYKYTLVEVSENSSIARPSTNIHWLKPLTYLQSMAAIQWWIATKRSTIREGIHVMNLIRYSSFSENSWIARPSANIDWYLLMYLQSMVTIQWWISTNTPLKSYQLEKLYRLGDSLYQFFSSQALISHIFG